MLALITPSGSLCRWMSHSVVKRIESMKRRVLVTGASGFIGKVLVPYLIEQGYEVRCLVRPTSNTQALEHLSVELVEGNLSDKASLSRAMKGVDVIYHLAAQINMSTKESFSEVNAKGTKKLLEAACEQDSRPAILAVSSLAATGPRQFVDKPSESDPMLPVSEYGHSKYESEKFLRVYADRLKISIVRPPMVLGAGDPMSLPMFKNVQSGIHPSVDKSQKFSMVYVKDLVRVMEKVANEGERIEKLDKANGQGVYFSGFKEPLTWEELGNKISKALGKNRLPWNIVIPRKVLMLVAKLMDRVEAVFGIKMPLSSDKATEAISGNWTCDVTKVLNQFDYSPLMSVDEALFEIVEGYRDLGMLK